MNYRTGGGLKKKLFDFDRGNDGLLSGLQAVHARLRMLSAGNRRLLLILLNVYLLFRLGWLVRWILGKVLAANKWSQIFSILYWDLFVYLVGIGLFLFLILMAAGSPEKSWGKIPLKGRPVIFFVTVTVGLGAFLIFFPTYILDALTGFESSLKGLSGHLPSTAYIKIVLVVAVGIAICLADLVTKKGSIHWWTLPFLLVPIPFFNLFPILWWSAASVWLPSKIWAFWKPVLALTTCMLPVLLFPALQELRGGVPTFSKVDMSTIRGVEKKCIGYGIQWVPGRAELFTNCNTYFCKVSRTGAGEKWGCSRSCLGTFTFDYASLDWHRSVGYVFNAQNSELHVVDLNSMKEKPTLKIPLEAFPYSDERVFQAYDPERQRLFIVGSGGLLLAFDVGNEPDGDYRKKYLESGAVVGVALTENGRHLVVLQAHRLSILDSNDLSIARSIYFSRVTFGMALDEIKGRIFISFPQMLEVAIHDLETLERTGAIDAPAGVRILDLDRTSDLLFVSSMSGVLEVRRLSDLRLIKRMRLHSWIHGLDYSAEIDHLGVTYNAGHAATVVEILGKAPQNDFMDFLLQSTEKLARFGRSFLVSNEDYYFSDRRKFFPEPEFELQGNGTVLLVCPDSVDLEMGAAMLRWGGFKVFAEKNAASAIETWNLHKDEISVILMDLSASTGTDENEMRKKWKVPKKVPVNFSTKCKSDNPTIGFGKVLCRPYVLTQILKHLNMSLRPTNVKSTP